MFDCEGDYSGGGDGGDTPFKMGYVASVCLVFLPWIGQFGVPNMTPNAQSTQLETGMLSLK